MLMTPVQYREVDDYFVVACSTTQLIDPLVISLVERDVTNEVKRLAAGTNVVFDFRAVDQASSLVLGLLLGVRKQVVDRNGTVVLCRVNERLMEMFRLTHIDTQFRFVGRLRDVLSKQRKVYATRSTGGEPQWMD